MNSSSVPYNRSAVYLLSPIAKLMLIFRLRRMHEMSTIVTDDHSTCLSVSLSVTLVGCAKTTAQIDVLFAVETLGAQRTLFFWWEWDCGEF